MSDNVIDLIDREEAIFRARLAGKSVRKIASEHRMTIASVKEIIERNAPEIDNKFRLMTLQLELERLDEMQKTFYQAAVDGDAQAAAIMIRIQDRRASYLALDCGVRVDPRPLPSEEAPSKNSLDQLVAALDAIAAEKPAPNLQLVSDTTADPPPEPPPES